MGYPQNRLADCKVEESNSVTVAAGSVGRCHGRPAESGGPLARRVLEIDQAETVIDQTVPNVRDAHRNGLSDQRNAVERLSSGVTDWRAVRRPCR